ncbi:hypothetical protein [Pseudodesulfovibrio sp.]|uniref:hypothetical protein n=1 Tax=unclassified Pseudodesulfovibrio TaxID=2661612 RepID=UPI003B00F2DA
MLPLVLGGDTCQFQTLFNPEALGGKYGVGGVSLPVAKAVIGSILATFIATALSVIISLFSAIGISRYGRNRKDDPPTL